MLDIFPLPVVIFPSRQFASDLPVSMFEPDCILTFQPPERLIWMVVAAYFVAPNLLYPLSGKG